MNKRCPYSLWWVIFSIIFCHEPVGGSEFGWDIFQEESVKENSFSSTEGLLSSIVANHVAVISGEFVSHETDCVLCGPEPLTLQRSYSSHPSIGMFGFEALPLHPDIAIEIGSKYCGWQFNHLTSLHFQVDLTKNTKHAQISAFIPHIFFSQMLHRAKVKVSKGLYKREDCNLPLLHQKGVTNCSLGAISGRTNPKNVIAHLHDDHKSCDVTFGSGSLRHYEGKAKEFSQNGEIGIWKLKPMYEKKANGNQVIYQGKHVYVYNSSGYTLFSSIKFNWISSTELHVETSHTQPIIYRYRPFKVDKTGPYDYKKNYYLTSLSRPDQPEESYEYTPDATKEGWLLCRKNLPNKRFLEIDYYKVGDQPGRIHKEPIYDYLDPRNRRVKCLKAPVGTDDTPIITHEFFYDLSFKVDHKKQKVKTYEGITTIYDAYHRKSIYIYNQYHRLEKMIQYAQDKPYLQAKYFWEDPEENEDSIDSYSSSNQGNLMGKVIQDGEDRILTARFFDYDEQGNILTEQFFGNLSGKSQIPIKLDKNHHPIKNGAESYKREFSYSTNGLNLLLEERELNGRKICYTYIPHTDLISSKKLLDHDRVCAREFYEYDENNAITTTICDNGTGSDKNDLSNVTQRHITHYYPRKTIPVGLPGQIDKMFLDMHSGQEQLIQRIMRTYSCDGKLIKQEVYDSSGAYCYCLEWDYDSHGNVLREMNALGQIIMREYDDNDNLIFEQGHCPDFYTTHTYDFSNRRICTEEVHANGGKFATHYLYDFVGNCISQVDRYGNETNYEYDELNRLTATLYPPTGKSSSIIKTSYDCLGNPIEEIDARGFVTKKSYNARGKVTSIEHPNGQLERFEYFLDGIIAKKIASNGTETHFEVDTFGRPLSEKGYTNTGKLLYVISNTYDSLQKISSTDACGLTTYYYYDGAGRLAKTVCLDKIEIYEYDSLGRVAKKTEPFDLDKIKSTCMEYDFLNRIIEERIEDEQQRILKKVSYQYDLLGNRTHLIEETQAGLSQHITLYNSDKKPIKIIDSDGNETNISYHYAYRNSTGQFVLQTTTTDPLGRKTFIIHDALERPVSIKKLDTFGLLLSYQEVNYDAQGNVIRINDHVIVQGKETKNIETTFAYQETGQLICLTQAYGLPEQQITHTKYNNFGQKVIVTKADGTLLHYEYDPLGRLQSYASSDQTIAYQYTYNARHQILHVKDFIQKADSHFEYDIKGRLIQEKLSNKTAISYEYDLLDRVTALILPDSSRIVYQYNAIHLNQIERFKKGKLLYTHRYDAFDKSGLNLKATTINQQKVVYTYDLLKRLIGVETNSLKQNGVQYDRNGHLLKYDLQDPIGSMHIQYNYDENDHLIYEEGHQKHTYTCDSLHNRISKDKIAYTSNGLNQLLRSGEYTYTYDPAGNLISKKKKNEVKNYQYDANDRLIVVKSDKEIRYIYDAFHRRVAKIEGNKTTRYFYVGQDEIGAVDESGKIQELRVLGQGHGAEIGASIAIELHGKIYAPSHDFRGNIINLADLNGNAIETYRYTAFGETTIYNSKREQISSSSIGNPWRFSSKRFDEETGFFNFGRRYYDPGNGRWITADPAGFADGTNLYAYLHHHPVNAFDLYGLQEETDQSGNQPYYPLDNVEYGISHEQMQTSEDALPNEAPLGFIEKKTGKKGKMFYCGISQMAEMGMGCISGIMNTLRDAYTMAKSISEMANDHFVTFVHNQSNGFVFFDLARCAFELYFNMKTASAIELQKKWDAFFANAGPNAMYFHVCHSEGAIITRNVLMDYPEDLRKRILVIAIAPGAYIDKKYAYEVIHYRSTRDIVPFFDFIGAYKCRNATMVLKPHPDAPLFDHSFNSPTYRDVLHQHVDLYSKEYGGAICAQSEL